MAPTSLLACPSLDLLCLLGDLLGGPIGCIHELGVLDSRKLRTGSSNVVLVGLRPNSRRIQLFRQLVRPRWQLRNFGPGRFELGLFFQEPREDVVNELEL